MRVDGVDDMKQDNVRVPHGSLQYKMRRRDFRT